MLDEDTKIDHDNLNSLNNNECNWINMIPGFKSHLGHREVFRTTKVPGDFCSHANIHGNMVK